MESTAALSDGGTGARARQRLLVIAPHPDDAEASCGGLIANTVRAGGSATILTMTGGELGVWQADPPQARAIRIEEARGGAARLGAVVEFFGALDGSLFADAATAGAFATAVGTAHPDVMVAPWPLDVHPDHQAAGVLAWRTFHDAVSTFDLYFYETANSPHTMSFAFQPTDFVDIAAVMIDKREAVSRHESQHPEEWFDLYEALARVRGAQSDTQHAEGYVRARLGSALGGRGDRTPTILPPPASRAGPLERLTPVEWRQDPSGRLG